MGEYDAPGESLDGGWSFYSGGEDVPMSDADIAAIRDAGLTTETEGYTGSSATSNPFDWGSAFKTILGVAGGVATALIPKQNTTGSTRPVLASGTRLGNKPYSLLGPKAGVNGAGGGGFLGGGGGDGGGGGFGFSPWMVIAAFGVLLIVVVARR